MMSRAPRVPWEAMYLPATEAVSYGLSFAGEGYVLLSNGKVLPWCRMAAWICTCPIMLGLVSNMALIKYKQWPLNPMMVAASLIRSVFGISATMAEHDNIIWLHAFFSFAAFFFEMVCAYAIFSITIQDFREIGSPLAQRVVGRLNLLRVIFFVTWNCYWVLWILNSGYLCIINEDANSILHLLGDLSCKNTYGIVLWATTWGLLNGKWDRDYARNRDENGVLMETNEKTPAEPPKENFDVKVFGTTIASVKRSVRKQRRDDDRRPRRGKYDDDYDDSDSSDGDRDRRRNRRGATRDEKRRRDYERDDSEFRSMPSTNSLGQLETKLMQMQQDDNSDPQQNIMQLLEMIKRNAGGADDAKDKRDNMC